MTFYDQDGSTAPDDEQVLDPDIWSEPEAPAPTAPAPTEVVTASAPPSARRSGPRRPGRPGAGPDAPATRRSRHSAEDDDGYFDMPHESRIPRWLAALLVVGLVIVVIVGGAMWWYHNQVEPSGGPGEVVEVQIPEGATTSGVADILDRKGVISSAMVFNFYVGGKDLRSVQAGSYQFRENSSFDDAIEVLNGGPDKPMAAVTTKVSIPEGYTVDKIVKRINEKVPRLTLDELNAALDEGKVPSALKPEGSNDYEGLLFPATYEVGDKASAVDVLTMMAQEMETRVAGMDIESAAAAISSKWGIQLTPYDLINVASLVQAEAGGPEEAPKVATVIYNRLREGWALGIDATSKYLAEQEGTSIDLDSDSPYNTRKSKGLPPTPIGSPGEYALDAALHPADGPWMYYVLTDPGVHTFAVTDAEFQQAKQICIQKDLGCG